jgi:hypothetical protein
VILQTGYAKEKPHREIIRDLGIQGYYNKIDGPEQLLLWVDVGLKAADNFKRLYKSRQSLDHILNAVPDLHKIQPLGDLLQGILMQISGLLGISSSFLAVLPCRKPGNRREASGYCTPETADETEPVIIAGTGELKNRPVLGKYFDNENLNRINQTLHNHDLLVEKGSAVIPVLTGKTEIGIIYVEKPAFSKEDLDLLKVFSSRTAAAIYNTELRRAEAFDPVI